MAVVRVELGFFLSYIDSWPKTLLPCVLPPFRTSDSSGFAEGKKSRRSQLWWLVNSEVLPDFQILHAVSFENAVAIRK